MLTKSQRRHLRRHRRRHHRSRRRRHRRRHCRFHCRRRRRRRRTSGLFVKAKRRHPRLKQTQPLKNTSLMSQR